MAVRTAVGVDDALGGRACERRGRGEKARSARGDSAGMAWRLQAHRGSGGKQEVAQCVCAHGGHTPSSFWRKEEDDWHGQMGRLGCTGKWAARLGQVTLSLSLFYFYFSISFALF